MKVNESAGKLNQAFVKKIVCLATLAEPELFENIMGFVKELLVEALEIAKIMCIHFPAAEVLDHGCDAR